MSTRITRSTLDHALRIFCNRAGLPRTDFTLEYQQGVGWQIDNWEGRHFSPQLSARELQIYLNGAIAALDLKEYRR